MKFRPFLKRSFTNFAWYPTIDTKFKKTRQITHYNANVQAFNDFFFIFQVGLSRSTTGSVSACLFREFQIAASYEGLIETVPGVNLGVLKMDRYEHEKEKDTLFRGEFEVVRELIAALPEADVSWIIAFGVNSLVSAGQWFAFLWYHWTSGHSVPLEYLQLIHSFCLTLGLKDFAFFFVMRLKFDVVKELIDLVILRNYLKNAYNWPHKQ